MGATVLRKCQCSLILFCTRFGFSAKFGLTDSEWNVNCTSEYGLISKFEYEMCHVALMTLGHPRTDIKAQTMPPSLVMYPLWLANVT